MELNGKLFEYLKKFFPEFEKTTKNGAYLFTCPNIQNHKYKGKSPSATIINGSDKITCFQCHFKGTFFDIVRLLEEDKKTWSDEQITIYLYDIFQIDAYAELDEYKKYNWTLVPIAKNSKNPIENDWTNKTHYEKVEWVKWISNELNIGVRTGKESNITVVDIDLKVSPIPTEVEGIMQLLKETDTLVQNTPHGLHYVFQYDKDLLQAVNLGNLHIDIRNDKGQIVIQPSKIDVASYHWKNLGAEIKVISATIKAKLLELNKVDKGRTPKLSQEMTTICDKVSIVQEGSRNETLISLGGILINKLTTEQTQFVLSLINQKFVNPPLPKFEIEAMLGSLSSYKETEDSTQEKVIYEYLKLMQNDVHAKDVMDNTGLKRAIVDKYLAKFVKEGKAIRLSRGRYKHREKVEWSDKFKTSDKVVPYKIPYFDEYSHFEPGDIILIGGKTSHGKTTLALNIIKQLVEQKLKPFYIYSESGSRHQKISSTLGLNEGEFYHSFHANPLSIEIESDAFTVLDWLLISEKENSDSIFKFFTEEMQRKGGILVILMQLKDNYDWFAPNLVTQFPAIAARYIFDDDNGLVGHFNLDKIRDPKGNYRTYNIECNYNPETKLLTAKKVI